MRRKIIVSGVGCCLVDMLYNNISFTSDCMHPYLSSTRGDGGLTPGKLVFLEEFERFSATSPDKFISAITGNKTYDKINIGGPSIVSLINAAQLTSRETCEVRFYGRAGDDHNGKYLYSSLQRTPVVLKDFKLIGNQRTPSTIVLSDPSFDNGHGERMFINTIGAAWKYRPEDLPEDFFDSDIVVFGGTALVPGIHDNLASLLKKAKSRGCITIVNTVFDFRNEKANPSKRWPFGENDESYKYSDLLITDKEEALRLSGGSNMHKAVIFFQNKKVPAFIITNGAANILTYSDGSLFRVSPLNAMPVSEEVKNEIRRSGEGDTTGCGDNFAGGVIASVADQLIRGITPPDLAESCAWGIASGGFACFYMGGTYFEENPGEKKVRIIHYYESYKKQISVR